LSVCRICVEKTCFFTGNIVTIMACKLLTKENGMLKITTKTKNCLYVVALFAAFALILGHGRARAACNTWSLNDPADFTTSHASISGGRASLDKSQEIGDAWEDVSLPPGTGSVNDLKQFSDGALYAATSVGIYGRVYKSTDGGVTWSNTATLEVPGVRRASKVKYINEGSGGSIYAATYDTSLGSDNSGVWRSTDWGASWTVMTGLPGSGCTGVVEAANGTLIATSKGDGRVWHCPAPSGVPGTWNEVWSTPSISYGLAPSTYPSYPPVYLAACPYLMVNYGEGCLGLPYDSYPDPYRTDRTQAPFRASDGTLYIATNTGSGSIYSGGEAVRGFGHIYVSTDNGLTWQDGGSFTPPPTTSPEYRYQDPPSFPGLDPHEQYDGSPAADNPPTAMTYPTWIDNFFEDSAGDIYACSTNGDPLRSWILNPRRDGVIYKLQDGATPPDNQWNALGNLYGAGDAQTDTYTSTNAVYCHDMDEDVDGGSFYAVTSVQAMVHRSTDGGATWDWFDSPRTYFGYLADGDYYCMELTCSSCLYVGYKNGGEVYASRSQYYTDGYVQNNTGWTYGGALTSFAETTASDSFGTITYWISDDGSTFYWWDGGSWSATADPAQSNAASVVNANIGSFPGPGTFYFRAFLHPATVSGCPKTPRLASVTVCAQGGVTPLVTMRRCLGLVNLYNVPRAGDRTYWDAEARNPTPFARDLWAIPDDMYVIQRMTEAEAGGGAEQELAVLKVEGGFDYNIYMYNSPLPGDWTYWDAMARNPSALARDLWMIPYGNDISLLADGGGDHIASMKNQSGDFNLYLYNSPYPGDWTYWDAVSRNPSPLARDLWVIPHGNDPVAMCGMDTTGDGASDSLLVVRNTSGDYNVYLWNMPVAGDWTYADAVSRNPSPLARDFWIIPWRNDILCVAGVNNGASFDELGVMENLYGDHNFYVWNAPRPGDATYWDAFARNPSALARDLWQIPLQNNTFAVGAPEGVPLP